MGLLLHRPLALLTAAGALLAVAAGPPDPGPDQIRQMAGEVFRRPEFNTDSNHATWLTRLLRDFLAWLGDLHGSFPVLYWALLVGCLLALAALIVLIVLQVRSAFTRSDREYNGASLRAQRMELSENHRAEANRQAALGDYTEAVRHLFLSLVFRFDERGRVSFQKAYTNREYLDLLRDRPAVRNGLQVLVDSLDEYWYGQRSCEREQYDACRAVYDRLAS